MIDFPNKLRSLRELNGWSQEELAKRLKVSRSKIGNYEQGTREPGFEDLEAIADVFNCPIAYLIEDNRIGPDNFYLFKETEDDAKELLDLYSSAEPDVRKAVLLLLKSSQRES